MYFSLSTVAAVLVLVARGALGRDIFQWRMQITYFAPISVVKRERTADEMIDEAKKVQAKSAQSVDRSKELVNNMIEVRSS